MQWEEVAAVLSLSLTGMLLLATLGWLRRMRRDAAAGYLLALLSLSGLQALEYLYHQQQWFLQWPHLLKLADPLVVMLPFCLYGYIRALQGESVLGCWRERLVHGLPLLLVAALALPYWLLPGADKVSWILLGKQGDALWPGVTLYGNRYLACIALLGLAYWWQQQRLGVVSRKPALRAWVAQLQGLQLLVALLLLGRIALSWLGWPLSTVYLQAPVTAYLLLQVLAHARLPQQGGAPEGGVRERANDTASESVRDHGLRPLFEALERQLGRGAYRDPALSLGKLAEECGLSLHQASSAINACSGATSTTGSIDIGWRRPSDCCRRATRLWLLSVTGPGSTASPPSTVLFAAIPARRRASFDARGCKRPSPPDEQPTKSPASGRAGRISCLSRYSSRRLLWMLFEDVVDLLFQFEFLFFQILHLGAVVAGVMFLQLSNLHIQVVMQVKLLLEMDITALQFRDELSVLWEHVMRPPWFRLIVPARPNYRVPCEINVIRLQFGTNDLLHAMGDF